MPAAAPPRPRVSPLEQWQANAKRMGAPAEMVLIVTVCVVLAGTPFWSFRGYAMLLGACMVFIATATALSSWRVTRWAGEIMEERCVAAMSNWKHHTLRSFTEVMLWLCTILRSYSATNNVCLSLLLGTACGICCVLIGERFALTIQTLEAEVMSSKQGRPKARSCCSCTAGPASRGILAAPWLLVFALLIVSNFRDFQNDMLVGTVLSLLTGICFVTCCQLFTFWRPTHKAGLVLQGRVLNAFENWSTQPLRSALELGFYISSLCASWSVYHDPFIACAVATICGVVTCLGSEVVMHLCGVEELAPQAQELDPVQEPVLLSLLMCSYPAVLLSYLFYEHFKNTVLALLLYSLAGAVFITAGRLFIALPLTHGLGVIVQGRVLNTKMNWQQRPVRSVCEVAAYLTTISVTYLAGASMCAAATTGTAAASFIAVTNDCLHAHCAKRRTLAQLETRARVQRAARPASARVSWVEFSSHDRDDNAWLLIHGVAYDVTHFAARHPGGEVILKYAGQDASDQFEAFHLPRVKKRLLALRVGEVDGAPKVRPQNEAFRQLRQRLWEEGWFKADMPFFVWKELLMVGFLAAALLAVRYGPNLYVRAVLGGGCVAMFWQQCAFIAHDAAHNGILPARPNGAFNLLSWLHGSVIFGISCRMWNDEHSTHHAMTMRPREDPQFNYLPLWLISLQERTHFKDLQWVEQVAARALVPFQHYTLLPANVLIGRFNLYAISVVYAVKNLHLDDLAGMGLYWAWYCWLTMQLPAGGYERLVFVLTAHWAVGILHLQLLLSHLATTQLSKEEEVETQWFGHQLATTRNINTVWYDHWFHGGLQYQIEHHLFPQMPRHNLPRVKPLVEKLCREHGVTYMTEDFGHALRMCLGDLEELSSALRNPFDE